MEDHICEEIRPLIPDFHDGEIKDKELYNKISKHLKVCEDCRAELEQLEALSKIVKKYFNVEEFDKNYKATEFVVNKLDEIQYCNNVRDKISVYVDNELPEEDRLIVEKHLKHCKMCYRDYDNLKLTSQIVQKYFDKINFSEAKVSDRVIDRLNAYRTKRIAISAAVAAVLGIALFHFVFINSFKPENLNNKSIKTKTGQQATEQKSQSEKILPGLSF